MHRLLLSLTMLITLTFHFMLQAHANELLIASGNPEAPPVMWQKSGTLSGIGPEVVINILDLEGIKYAIRPEGSWQDVQEKARSGGIDMIVAAYDNAERRTYMDYSIPYLESPVVILVKKGQEFPFTGWNDLIGKKGVANAGESFGEEFDAFIKEKLKVTYTSYEKAFAMLSDGLADFLVTDLFPAVIYSKMLLAEDKVSYLENPATLQHFHVTISKKSPYLYLMPKINARIQEMRDKGAINTITLEQYKTWNKTLQARQLMFERADAEARKAQEEFDAGARDRGLDKLSEFLQKDLSYLSN